MSKFACRCGYVMKFHTGRENYDVNLIPSASLEDVGAILSEQGNLSFDAFYDIIEKNLVKVMNCPHCERLWIDQGEGIFRSYAPEPENYTLPEESAPVQSKRNWFKRLFK